ncbi:MAG: Succinate-semialdehyde dehydrogenase (acetylating) [Phycisphaerae bacterium]|nr:Succinate-semialdehyde dehydrogenase (acetylating) [Phycisphaerae bacterium]
MSQVQVDESLVRNLVEKVLQHVQTGWGGRVAPTPGAGVASPVSAGPPVRGAVQADSRFGQFTDVDQAVAAARVAHRALMQRSLAQRAVACDLIRNICTVQADELGRMEYEETKIGHPPHKPEKLRLVSRIAQGIEVLRSECFSGDHGLTVEEHAPWGVIGVITPVTHSLPTLANNAVNMIAGGNSLVVNPHPSGWRIAAHGARLFNQAIYEKLGIDNLICVIGSPTLESAQKIFKHPGVDILCVTGGPGAVAAAMASGKRAICAGPGNPPVVVDASADIANAARCIVEGATFDNNLLCLSEKELFVEAAIFDKLMAALTNAGACRLSPDQMDKLAAACIDKDAATGHYIARRQFVGAEPAAIAREIGVEVPPACRMLFGQVGTNLHPFVQAEQMMPVMPVVSCRGFDQCVEFALQAEHGFRHTAVIHSRLVDHMTQMGKAMDTTLYVKNGPSLAGDAAGGEGYGSYSIACGTGEGVTTPLTFTRTRRCTMVDNLRII